MKISKALVSAFVGFAIWLSIPVYAETANEPGPLYIIFDGSNSMWGELPDKSRKITVAKNVFNALDPAVFAGRDIALRIYGHRRARDCSDTELVVPFGSADKSISKISHQVNAVTPRGKTPITRSLIAALEDFGDRSGDILLISDGIETCDADPCELVQSWRERGIEIKVHVVGLGLTEQSRSAMQCIAAAAGTTYMDANAASDLTSAIEIAAAGIPLEPGEPDPEPGPTSLEFKIVGEDENGSYVPVAGTLYRQGMSPREIASNARYVFEGGQYSITVGVPTVIGEIYAPVTQDIEVQSSGSTKIRVKLQRPPTIRTKFIENDEQIRGVITYVYQNGNEVFRLRPDEDYFVLPGSYKFTADLNSDNQLEVAETIAVGDDKDIVFQAIETVHTTFNVFAQGQNKKLRQHQQLWQGGELKYKVHVHNGAQIKPGIYTLHSEHILTPYEIENIQVPAVERQTLEFTVPFGSAQISYIFKQPPEQAGRRCWLIPVDKQGILASAKSSALKCDGSEIVLIAGRYFVRVWSTLGDFEDTYFEVKTSQTAVVSIQQKISIPNK